MGRVLELRDLSVPFHPNHSEIRNSTSEGEPGAKWSHHPALTTQRWAPTHPFGSLPLIFGPALLEITFLHDQKSSLSLPGQRGVLRLEHSSGTGRTGTRAQRGHGWERPSPFQLGALAFPARNQQP